MQVTESGPNRGLKFLARKPLTEFFPEIIIQHLHAGLQQEVCATACPAHL
jgi:hypothetical protein